MLAGAIGYVLKDTPSDELIEAIRNNCFGSMVYYFCLVFMKQIGKRFGQDQQSDHRHSWYGIRRE